MNWHAMKDRVPPEEGIYFVYAPSADPDKPLYSHAWWAGDHWEQIVQYWARAITHWCNPVPPVNA